MSKSLYVYNGEFSTFDKIGEFSEDECFLRALPGEPRFTLLARDPDFARLVGLWAERRAADIACGDRPATDSRLIAVANATARNGTVWRRENMGKWRRS